MAQGQRSPPAAAPMIPGSGYSTVVMGGEMARTETLLQQFRP